jgi:hypothetical protein
LDDFGMRILRIALVAVAVLAGATACKNSDADNKSLPETADSAPAADAASVPPVADATVAAKAGTADPCSLVTAAEITSTTGITYPKGASAMGEVNYCKYVTGSHYLLVEVYPAGDAGVYSRAVKGAAGVAGGTVAKVGGIGDEAGYVARAGTLCVHAGTRNLCVAGPDQKADVALARKALSRM